MTGGGANSRSSRQTRAPRRVGLAVTWSIIAALTLWALAALYLDIRVPSLRTPVTLLYASGIAAVLSAFGTRGVAALVCLSAFCGVLTWWLGLQPSNRGPWRSDTVRTAWAAVEGERITIHNLRNCDYRTEFDYANCWSDRTVDLSQIRALDLFFINWGLPWTDHTIASFQFGSNDHIAFSIEPRFHTGQSYSAIRGFFRQYELIFVAADERDVIRLRTNYRANEEVYLYRTRIRPDEAREIFLSYLDYLNRLSHHPEWYNALTRNCSTTMSRKVLGTPPSWESRFVGSGSLEELLFARGRLAAGGLTFPALKRRAHINAAALAANHSPGFSALIRVGRVGF